MKLINCPVCGTRCSAVAEKCPECGFEIKSYFGNIKQDTKKHRHPVIFVAGLAAAVIILLVLIATYNRSSVSVTNPSPGAKSLDDLFPLESQQESSITVPSQDASNGIDVSGVYSGDDHEILVLNDDGLAYYYCTSIEFTELQCPWYIRDDDVCIDFSRLHCTVNAKIDEKELLFKSDSINWNTELFTKLDVEPEQYLSKALSTSDPNATLNYDGTLSYQLDGISYTLPKSFVDFEDSFDSMPDSSAFIDYDVQSDYSSAVLFHRTSGKPLDESSAQKDVLSFTSGFFDNPSTDGCVATSVAGYNGYLVNVSGYLNKGFSRLQNYEASGFVIIFYNNQTRNNNYIMMVQSTNRNIDNTAKFGEILKSAH
ncbi:hypothetical protein [Butyrivibrio sp.]|uniref:hypothetical protein n=1 Tax=Butyrivibrio sp. TaxID=28121 RepID=UPI0025C41A73|nr:hypothetical protein [Butyrivibrio sp.]MBE5837951.1 hypothetical protein [Butyrivibrio sp.]